jgi:uncharacterized protein YjcR
LRNLHYGVFPAAVLLYVHSLLADPNLKDGHPDLLEGGKVFVEIADLLGIAAVTVRVWLRRRGLRPGSVVPRAMVQKEENSIESAAIKQ